MHVISEMPEVPPTLQTLLAPADVSMPVLPVLAGVLTVFYVVGAGRLWLQGRRWSVWRTISFLLGCLLLATITGLGTETYGEALVSVFMFQQLTLMMTVPPLLVLGSPGTLLLRSTPHRGAGRVLLVAALTGLRSPAAKWILSPWCTVPLYLFAFYGLYLAGAADIVLALPAGHVLLEMGFLLTGILFTIPILSSDPLPVRMGHGARALDVFAEAALHAFFGVFLMMASTILVGSFVAPSEALGIDTLEDQQLAGALAWSYGEAPTVLMLIYVMHRWFRSDTATAAAADRYTDLHGNTELDAYNSYLKELEAHDRER